MANVVSFGNEKASGISVDKLIDNQTFNLSGSGGKTLTLFSQSDFNTAYDMLVVIPTSARLQVNPNQNATVTLNVANNNIMVFNMYSGMDSVDYTKDFDAYYFFIKYGYYLFNISQYQYPYHESENKNNGYIQIASGTNQTVIGNDIIFSIDMEGQSFNFESSVTLSLLGIKL